MRQKPWYEFHFNLGILFDQNLLANVKTGLIINGGRQEKKPRKVESFLSFLNNEKSFPLPPLIQEQWQIFIPSYSLLSPFDYCWWDNWTGKTDTNWQNYNDAFSMVPHGSDSKNPPKLINCGEKSKWETFALREGIRFLKRYFNITTTARPF